MILCINANIFIDTQAEDDEAMNNAVATFEQGASSALSHFPEGDVIQVDVEDARKLNAEEISERGFEE